MTEMNEYLFDRCQKAAHELVSGRTVRTHKSVLEFFELKPAELARIIGEEVVTLAFHYEMEGEYKVWITVKGSDVYLKCKVA